MDGSQGTSLEAESVHFLNKYYAALLNVIKAETKSEIYWDIGIVVPTLPYEEPQCHYHYRHPKLEASLCQL